MTPGTRLGVYRARETKLQRDVAIKVLPALFARDPERLAIRLGVRADAVRDSRTSRDAGRPLPYALTRDGQKLVINTWDAGNAIEPLTVVVNWPAAIK